MLTGAVNAVKPRNAARLCHHFQGEASCIGPCRDRDHIVDEVDRKLLAENPGHVARITTGLVASISYMFQKLAPKSSCRDDHNKRISRGTQEMLPKAISTLRGWTPRTHELPKT